MGRDSVWAGFCGPGSVGAGLRGAGLHGSRDPVGGVLWGRGFKDGLVIG